MSDFSHDYNVPMGMLDEFDVEIFVDNGLVELSADRGRVWATNLHFPAEVAGRVVLTRVTIGTALEPAGV
jgi:hypothetical protein